MINPIIYNMKIFKGRDFLQSFIFQDEAGVNINLVNWMTKSQIREKQKADSDLIATFYIDSTDISNGKIILSLTDEITSAIINERGFYDIVLTDTNGLKHTLVYGKVDFINTPTI